MGYNTTIFILNDHLGDIERNKERFVTELAQAIHSMGRITEIMGQTTVMKTEHADVHRLYFTYGNAIVELDRPWTEDDKREVAKHPDFYLKAIRSAKSKIKELETFIKSLPNEKDRHPKIRG